MVRRGGAAFLIGVAVLLGASVLGATPVAAHAVLAASAPSDGARLSSPPTEVGLTFNEDVAVLPGSLRVFDDQGVRVDRGAQRHDGAVLEVDLVDGLSDGSYVAAYRVTSTDGHPVRGGIVFAIGEVAADRGLLGQIFDDGADRAWSVVAALSRWVTLVGSLGVAGVALAAVRGPVVAPRTRRLLLCGLVATIAGAATALSAQAALVTGRGPGAITEPGVARAVWDDGALGLSLVLVVLGAVVALPAVPRTAALADGRSTRRPPVVACAVVSTCAVAVGAALSGHTRIGDAEVVAVLSASVHAAVVAVWSGGLLVGVLGGWRTEADRMAHLRRFSSWAAVSVLVVVVTGAAMAWREVRALDAVDTAYGWMLLVKVAIVGAVLVLAARVRRDLGAERPGSGIDAGVPLRRRRGLLVGEVVGLAVVLGLTAVLVNVTPARVAAGIGEIAAATIDLGEDGRIDVVVDPADPGTVNTVHFYVFDETGRVADAVEEAIVSLSLPEADIGPIVREPQRAGPAHFILVGEELVLAGRWAVEVQVRQSRFESATGTAEILIR